MSERMLWSEAENVVREYRAEQRLGEKPRRRFIDRSGAVSAALTLAIAATAIVYGGTSLIQRHPLVAKFNRSYPMPVAPMPSGPTIQFRTDVDGRTYAIEQGEAHLGSFELNPDRTLWIHPTDEPTL